MIELGGSIKLDGFNSVDIPSLIVVKKIVGNYAKKISENNAEYKELLLEVLSTGPTYELSATLTTSSKVYTSKASDINLFFALNKVLNGVQKE